MDRAGGLNITDCSQLQQDPDREEFSRQFTYQGTVSELSWTALFGISGVFCSNIDLDSCLRSKGQAFEIGFRLQSPRFHYSAGLCTRLL